MEFTVKKYARDNALQFTFCWICQHCYIQLWHLRKRGDVITPTRRRWSSEWPPGNIYNTDHKGHPSRCFSRVFPRLMPRARPPPPATITRPSERQIRDMMAVVKEWLLCIQSAMCCQAPGCSAAIPVRVKDRKSVQIIFLGRKYKKWGKEICFCAALELPDQVGARYCLWPSHKLVGISFFWHYMCMKLVSPSKNTNCESQKNMSHMLTRKPSMGFDRNVQNS